MKQGFSLVESLLMCSRLFLLKKTWNSCRRNAHGCARYAHRASSGFSLVELSIVLVILGLLTGGILTGQNLIRAAELRSVSTQLTQYRTAFYTFRDKYFAVPGDMTNATAFWGAQDGDDGLGSDCFNDPSTTPATCNGNGDGSIASYPLTETYRAWQQLANAGLIEGTYTGAGTSAPTNGNTRFSAAGVNVPASKINSGAFYWLGSGIMDGSSWSWKVDLVVPLMVGMVEPNDIPEDPLLTPEEAWNIDKKLDDGKPGTGSVITTRVASDCNSSTNLADQATATYRLDHNVIGCWLIFNSR
jgi:prepilin-type N-terminal cleavage/methylation domain-containing protein